MNQKVDYLIIGMGLCGSALAWELMQRGKRIVVFDQPEQNNASALAAGLFNPITGKYLTKTWNADTLFPFFEKFYPEAEQKLSKKFFHLVPIYRPFASMDEKNLWRQKHETGEITSYMLRMHTEPAFTHQVRNALGGIEIGHSGYLKVAQWIEAIREYLIAKDAYRQEFFDEKEMNSADSILYKGWEAEKIIFCNGLSVTGSSWWTKLPVLPLKGELLKVKIDAVMERIYNRGVYIVPSHEENTYVIGSTYERPPFQEGLTSVAREELQTRLGELTIYPFEILHQDWGIRPTTPDRKPILGSHPRNGNLIVFNGLGTKGVTLAPYFAHQLSDWLEGRNHLSPEVNINRFKALYSGLL